VILLAVYAVAVCLLVAKHRRRPLGYAVALLGAAMPLAVLALIRRVVPPSDDVSALSISLIMYAEAGFLLVMGVFLASLPRATPRGMVCARCHYDLGGLDPAGLSCPECGQAWRGKGSGQEEPEPERIPIPRGPVKRRKPHL